MKNSFKYILIALLVFTGVTLFGQQDSRYDAGMNLPFNEKAGEVNPQTGNITLSYGDLSLPGRAGYNFTFGRVWSLNRSNIFNMYEENGFNKLNSNTVERYSRMGVGWTNNLPYIMKNSDTANLVMTLFFGGGAYEIDQTNVTGPERADSNLVGYDLTDMKIFSDGAISYANFDDSKSTPGFNGMTLASLKSPFGISDAVGDKAVYKLLLKSNESFYFRADGNLMMQQDRTGLNRIWYFYEKIGFTEEVRLKLVVDTIGRKIRFSYDANGNLSQIEWDVKVGVKNSVATNTRGYETITKRVKYSYRELESALDEEGNLRFPLLGDFKRNRFVLNYKKSYLLKEVTDPMGHVTRFDYREGEAAFTFDSRQSHYKNLFLMLTSISSIYTAIDGKYKNKRVFEYETPAKGLYKKWFYRGYMEHYRLTRQYVLNKDGVENMDTRYIYFEKGENSNFNQYSTIIKMDKVSKSYIYHSSSGAKDNLLAQIQTETEDGFIELRKFEYSPKRRKIGESVSRGGSHAYSEIFDYDKKGNLIDHTNRAGLKTYTEYHNIFSMPTLIKKTLKDTAGTTVIYKSENIIDANLGYVTGQKLHLKGWLEPVITTISYDSYGNVISKEDAKGNVQHIVYDSEYKAFPVKVYQDVTIADWTAPGTVHDNWKSDPTGTDKVRIRSWKVFNSDGTLWMEIDNEGYAIEHYYDLNGQEIETVNPDGDDLTDFAKPIKVNLDGTVAAGDFDSFLDNSQLAAFLATRENNPGARIEIDYQADFVQTFADVDRAKGLVKSTAVQGDGLGNTIEEIEYKKDGAGYLSHAVRKTAYDRYGRMVAITDPDAEPTSAIPAEINGVMVERFDKTWLIKYDDLGRKSRIYYPGEGGSSPTKSVIYNDAENSVITVDPEGQIRKELYDWSGNLIKVTVYKDMNMTEEHAESYNFKYDELGRKILFTDALGYRTEYHYDERNLLVKQSYLDDGGSDFMTYNMLGQLTDKKDRKGQIITFSYDELGRNTKSLHYKSEADKTANLVAHSVTMDYDNRGNAVRISNLNLTEHYIYDHGNRVVTLERKLKEQSTIDLLFANKVWSSVSADAHIYTFSYDYNDAGMITAMHYPDGKVHSYDYEDSLNRLAKIKEGDTKALATDFVSSLSYNKSGVVTSMNYANGTNQSWQFDNRKRIKQIKIGGITGNDNGITLNYIVNGSGNVTKINNNVYSYDSFNRLTSAKTQIPGKKDHEILVIKSFGTYDGGDPIDGRVFNAAADLHKDGRINGRDHYEAALRDQSSIYDEESFTYDKNGNRTKLVQNGDDYRYVYQPQTNRLTEIHVTKKGEVEKLFAKYTYDANGNTETRTIYNVAGNRVITFEYDTMNRLVKTTDETNKVTQYYYDNAGNRLIKKTDDKLTLYLRHGQLAVAQDIEVDLKGAPVSGSPAIDQPVLTLNFDGNVSDTSGNLFTVQQVGAISYVSGNTGQAIDFSSTADNHLKIAHSNKLSGFSQFHISGWAKKTHLKAAGNIVYKHMEYGITLGEKSVTAFAMSETTGQAVRVESYSNLAVNDTNWHYYELIYDGVELVLKVDNQVIQRTPMTGKVMNNTSPDSNSLFIGKNPWGEPLDALIDDVQIKTAATTQGGGSPYYKSNRYILSGDLLAGRVTDTYLNGAKTKTDKYYYHLDHLNSTKAVTKADGTLEVLYEYRAFGEQLKRLDGVGAETGDKAKYSYGGKELDDSSNLYYFNARYYDATIGRFINVDPIQDGTNWYVYCSNNPMSFVDPTGLAQGSITRNRTNYKVFQQRVSDNYLSYLVYFEYKINKTKNGNQLEINEGSFKLRIFQSEKNAPSILRGDSYVFGENYKLYTIPNEYFFSVDDRSSFDMKKYNYPNILYTKDGPIKEVFGIDLDIYGYLLKSSELKVQPSVSVSNDNGMTVGLAFSNEKNSKMDASDEAYVSTKATIELSITNSKKNKHSMRLKKETSIRSKRE